ncbi:hypothetical protein G3A49_08125 [Haloferax volcanii]|uniref:Uncharacterized protein n=1 Tax=Haloferax volcanii TaxID=2246 RepID=A0A6C0URI4_HALVO|nr:hypothetical protein [Haloferax alexandrinus]QIB78102.1 hypothetical protein G3A49_08125 [Haloferax alexandrinus]
MSSSPWTGNFATEKSECAADVQRLLEKYPQPVVYEVMSELLRREMREQFAGAYAMSQQSED